MAANAILIVAPSWNQEPWAARIRAAEPGRTVFLWPDVPDRKAVAYAIAWWPPKGSLDNLPNLRAIFSMGAGVDNLFAHDLPDVPIARMVDPDLTARMTEWVTLQVLLHHRQLRAYDAQKAERRWRELTQPAASEVRVGIMGMGVLGGDAAAVLARLGFQVSGWSKRASQVPGVQSFHGGGQLDAFLGRTDILVSLLPLTPETRGILAMPLFRRLAQDGALGAPFLINAGRGGLQVEADILAALDQGMLGGASLDVFETEPLPDGSPLWWHPKVTITPHAAAWSSPAQLAPAIHRQILDLEAGKPLANPVDRAAQY